MVSCLKCGRQTQDWRKYCNICYAPIGKWIKTKNRESAINNQKNVKKT